jgi:hypothetical protein
MKRRMKMGKTKQRTTGGPKCPNHHVPLQGCSGIKSGKGVCPVSGALFDFESDASETEVVLDAYGNPTTNYILNGE